MSKKLGIFLVSKNNYQLLPGWVDRVNTEGYEVLNIDEDSTPENKEIGKEKCNEFNIHYMDREEKGLQNNIQSACDYFEKLGCEWVIAFQHDCYPMDDIFFDKFESIIETGKLDGFGVVGFNIHHDGVYQILSRTPLQQPSSDLMVRTPIGVQFPTPYNSPHSVESVYWTAAAVNIKQYNKYIIPTSDYQMFHAWDDIAFQFLYNNIHNVVLPDFRMSHEQEVKEEFAIPIKSPHASEEKREHFWGHFDHLKIWIERWGFDYMDRRTFEAVKYHYKGTLIEEFYNNDMNQGPIKVFDIW